MKERMLDANKMRKEDLAHLLGKFEWQIIGADEKDVHLEVVGKFMPQGCLGGGGPMGGKGADK